MEDKNSNIIKCIVTINRQFFPKNQPICDGEFGILSVEVKETIEGNPKESKWGTITIKGNMCEIDWRKSYQIVASEEETTYGIQYNILYISEHIRLENISDQKKFLSNILTKNQLFNVFDTLKDPIEVIKNEDIKTLCTVNGIGEKVASKIIDKYNECKDYSKAYIELYNLGLSKSMMDKLIESYGSSDILVDKIKNNIYIIADEVNGIGFKKADELAMRNGITCNDIRRVKAFIKYFLNSKANEGKSYVFYKELKIGVRTFLVGLDKNTFVQAIKELKNKNIIWWNEDKTKIALVKYKKLEDDIYNEIQRLNCKNNKFKYDNWEDIVKQQEQTQGWEYTSEQKQGIKTILDNNITLVTGLAGTGKSTIVNAVTSVLHKYSIQQCALAGRAAQRLNEISGIESNTIHKTLGYVPKQGFLYNKENKLKTDILIIDESSMIGGELFLSLLKAISENTKVIILGDHGQLDSIGACNVFCDLLNSKTLPIVKLTIVHRQAKASAIISKSIDIRKQIQLFDNEFEGTKILGELQDLYLDITKDRTTLQDKILRHFKDNLKKVDDIMDLQVIVPVKTRGKICTYELNKLIQQIYNNPEDKDYLEIKYSKNVSYKITDGDKVINVDNGKVRDINGEIISIFNGDLGIVKRIDSEKKQVIVDFINRGIVIIKGKTLKSLQLAYAITVHKLQGSSAKICLVGIDYSAFKLLSAELLYTAITRSEDMCYLIGENGAIRQAIQHISTKNKRTFLQEKIKLEKN